jgi:hypothetical protein
MRRTIAVALSAAGLAAGIGSVAQASPPNGTPHPNENAVNAVCDNVPHHAAAYKLFDCND